MSTNYNFASRVVVDPDVMFRVVKDETVILNLKTEQYLGLNETATRIWSALTSARTIQEAYEVVLEEFDVGAEELQKDMREILDAMVAQRLIAIVPEG